MSFRRLRMGTGRARATTAGPSRSTRRSWSSGTSHRAATRTAPTSTWRSTRWRWPSPTATSTPTSSSAATATSSRWSRSSNSTDKQIFVVGGRAFTSMVMQRNCHEFIAYENLVGSRRSPADRGRSSGPVSTTSIEQAVPLVRRALKVLADREVSPQLGLLKSTLLQLDSTFSERTYGAGSFRDFAQKLASAGHVTLREAGRNVLVELSEGSGAVADDTRLPPQVLAAAPGPPRSGRTAGTPSRDAPRAAAAPRGRRASGGGRPGKRRRTADRGRDS